MGLIRNHLNNVLRNNEKKKKMAYFKFGSMQTQVNKIQYNFNDGNKN